MIATLAALTVLLSATPPAPVQGDITAVPGDVRAVTGDTLPVLGRIDPIMGDVRSPRHTGTLLDEVRFCFACAQLTAGDRERLRRLAERLPAGTALVVEGHADSTGSQDYNDDLSRRRAEGVADVLRDHPLTLTVEWFGERRPRGLGDAADRRVEVRIGAPAGAAP